MANTTAQAIRDVLVSPNVADSNFESANVVDVINYVSNSIRHGTSVIADAITPRDAAGRRDDSGTHVGSLTEAVMGLTSGLCSIAAAINNLAEAVREAKE